MQPVTVVRIISFASLLLVSTLALADAPTTGADGDPLPTGWYARIDTTLGDVVVELLPEQAPQAVAHVAAMAQGRMEYFDVVTGEAKKERYYDGIAVHRAVAGQRFEFGDPTGTGRGSPRLFVPLEQGPVNFTKPGRVGLTRDGFGRISAVQLFITESGLPWLNSKHTCLGRVVDGLDAVQRISRVKTYSNERPIEPPLIERVEIFSVGDPPPLPEPRRHAPERGPLRKRTDR